jgi:hypothetical protein
VSCDTVLIVTVSVVNIISFSVLVAHLLYSFFTPDVKNWNRTLKFVIPVHLLLCNAICCVMREVTFKQKDGVVLIVMWIPLKELE